MSEFSLPDDLPRLYTIRTLLLSLLTAVNNAIEEAEDPRPRGAKTARRWCVEWRRTPAGQTTRIGVLHVAECMLATGEPMDARTVQAERRRAGHRIEPCETCTPRLPLSRTVTGPQALCQAGVDGGPGDLVRSPGCSIGAVAVT
ncbi:hypothetical protein [Streptomyces winkii]|uniref:hypothetical protein n=1 Tax=Streptomyces winkii TaxID=3051178 RepID=UPI0028D3D8E7|nr:hypothetical protein [Streptomyces sp. DSM 40971]